MRGERELKCFLKKQNIWDAFIIIQKRLKLSLSAKKEKKDYNMPEQPELSLSDLKDSN